LGVILDTNAVSALLSGDKELGRILSSADRHHLPLPVIAEYLFGLLASRRKRRLESLFRRLESDSYVLSPDRETANIYALVRRELKRRGTPIPEHDIWIAALAIQFSLDVASRDPHFDLVSGVSRAAW
jgi:tRNA(fMet)-specific endonuclease VapC